MSSSQHDQIVAGQVAFIVFCAVIEVAISYIIRKQLGSDPNIVLQACGNARQHLISI